MLLTVFPREPRDLRVSPSTIELSVRIKKIVLLMYYSVSHRKRNQSPTTDADLTEIVGVAAVTTYGALLAHKKTGNRINFGDVIGERLCWPVKWARLLSIDFFICPSEYQLFYTQKNLSAMTFGGTFRKH